MEPRVTYPDLQSYPGVRNAVLVDRHSRVNFAEIGKKKYPSGAILHYDANLDPYTEQTGGVHTFNHAVLAPQYQRNADGSYTDVGAKPAVDTFGGEKWLRSCGAVANLLPSGPLTSWLVYNAELSLVSGDTYLLSRLGTSAYAYVTTSRVIGQTYYQAIIAKASVGAAVRLGAGNDFIEYNLVTGLLVNSIGSGTGTITHVSDGWYLCEYFYVPAAASITYRIWAIDGDIFIRNPILSATAYPVPYVPPGVTQPASNATTTNGMWFANPDGSPLWKALTGEPLTLATRVRMGVGSGDLAAAVVDMAIVSCSGGGEGRWTQMLRGGVGEANVRIVQCSDGTAFPLIAGATWPRNVIIRRVTQVSAAGTQFRVGYMIEGTHTTIQWSSWVNFDGSFGPSTLYRLMLGFANAYPMWFNKITVWKEQVSDARILEAMA